MVALPRCRLHCSLAHWASGSLSRSGASWGSPPVRRCQTVHRTVRLASPPLLTHWRRSACSTVRNRRAASLPLASLVAHWASASLPRPLDAVGVGPISSRWLKDRPERTGDRQQKKKPCVRRVLSFGIRQLLGVTNGMSPPVSFVLEVLPCKSTVRDSRPAHLRSRRSFAHWASASLPRPLDTVGVGPISSPCWRQSPGEWETAGINKTNTPYWGVRFVGIRQLPE